MNLQQSCNSSFQRKRLFTHTISQAKKASLNLSILNYNEFASWQSINWFQIANYFTEFAHIIFALNIDFKA